MNEQACHLVDRVLPRAPYRQWVLTLPPELARRVAFDAELAGKVFGLFAAELARWQEETARATGVDDPHAGSVMEVQRFADGARLWPHAHVLAPDGVFHEAPDGSVRFVGHAAPCERDLELVLTRLESRVLSLLKRGRADRDEDADASEDPAQRLLACSNTTAAAHRAPKPIASPRRRSPHRQRLCVRSETGFELHAEVRVPSHDRGALERLCRYMARPPIAEDRLVRREDGRVELRLKRAWKGDVCALVFEPRELRPRAPPRCVSRPSFPSRISTRGSSSGSSRRATRSAAASSRSRLLQPLSGLWPPSARGGWAGRTCSAGCGTSTPSGARGAAGESEPAVAGSDSLGRLWCALARARA